MDNVRESSGLSLFFFFVIVFFFFIIFLALPLSYFLMKVVHYHCVGKQWNSPPPPPPPRLTAVLFISLSLSFSLFLSIYLSIYQSIYLFISLCLSLCRSRARSHRRSLARFYSYSHQVNVTLNHNCILHAINSLQANQDSLDSTLTVASNSSIMTVYTLSKSRERFFKFLDLKQRLFIKKKSRTNN